MFDRKKVCFITTRIKGDYCFYGIQALGYPIAIPYTDFNLFMRCLREAWFRLKLPGRRMFYNRACKRIQAELYIVRDSLMTPDFLVWLRECHPEARIILDYDNLVRGTIHPDSVPEDIEKWTYSPEDCEKYGMNRAEHGGYYDSWKMKKMEEPIYDIVYVGRDKGRAETLLAFEKSLQDMGLRTNFHICADRRFMTWKKPYYKPLLQYQQYLDFVGQSRALLNIAQAGCTATTMREVEAAFHQVKCVTDNKAIMEDEIYHPSRYFVLGVDPIENLPAFLESPVVPLTEEEAWLVCFDRGVEERYYHKTKE